MAIARAAATAQSGAVSCTNRGAVASQEPAAGPARVTSRITLHARSASASPASSSARAARPSPVLSRHRPRWKRARARPKSRSARAAAHASSYIPMTSRSRTIASLVLPAASDASATRVSTSMRRASYASGSAAASTA
ncbi:MAG: hypothetical protein J2P25_12690 [Nocardiopsaceae bacterium]|nr:hypothetical protein [Nocardiopsaceae bacterium]